MSKFTMVDGGTRWNCHSGNDDMGKFFFNVSKENLTTGETYMINILSMVRYIENLKEEDKVKYIKDVLEGFSE